MSVSPETGDVPPDAGAVSSAAGEIPPIPSAPPVAPAPVVTAPPDASAPSVPPAAPVPPAMLRAMQPAGALFALGWAMAALFDPRRRASIAQRQPPFDQSVQLPLVADLDPVPKLEFYAAELAELTRYYPDLAQPVAAFIAQVAAKDAATADEPSAGGYATAAQVLNEAILDLFADDPERLNAYQLGLALSDMCWLPYLAKAGDARVTGEPDAFMGIFARHQVAALKTLLSGSGSQLPAGAAGIVSQSVDNWADWVDVNVAKVKAGNGGWAATAGLVLDALRIQGGVWHSILTADPDVSVSPTMGAWVQAGTSIARATRLMTVAILRRFWLVVLLGLAALGALLYLVISNLSGISQVWASLVTVAAIVGGGGFGLGNGVSQSFGGVGYEIWSAAKLDAAAWNITWLPAVKSGATARRKLSARGVASPQIRNLDAKQGQPPAALG